MRITLLTAGTLGDVLPFVALARGLEAADYDVRLAVPPAFDKLVAEHDIAFAPLANDYYDAVLTGRMKALRSGSHQKVMHNIKNVILPMARALLDDAWCAAKDADVIIFGPSVFAGSHIAERRDIPAFIASFAPIFTPTRAFPSPIVSIRSLGGFLNRLSYLHTWPLKLQFHKTINEWRREVLDLPPRSLLTSETKHRGERIPVLHSYSRHLVPVPEDWPASSVVTGFWRIASAPDWRPPTDLVEFIEGGPPPIYVGFGSMVPRAPEELTRNVLAAIEQTGQRAVLKKASFALDYGGVPASCFLIESAPFDWLFPRMAAVVHHGGAGTLAAGLLAGRPSVVCPFFFDQPFWGNVVHRLGYSAKPIPLRTLTADNLANAISSVVGNTEMQDRVGQIGEALRAEDGVGCAVEFINAWLETH